ncbi:transcriptional regulator [Ahniella affigens]|uniref:Transcriptional regulator n=1 Tax=Ahniella affigens TaxID=2021234 RepID=A0A2P1PQV0_9GAMM|nr:helix-turn-helix transcriptional regulator [Ahniella affigens]AVP97201.1 transcriptional regulator [Ahniella affigens]
MPKSIHRQEAQILVALIREYRIAAGLKQTELSERLGRTQSFISDVERGQRRLDLVQLRDLVTILGRTLPRFVQEFERRIAGLGP